MAPHKERRSHARQCDHQIESASLVVLPEGPDDDPHEWEAAPYSRHQHGCPYCSGKRPDAKTSLAACFPGIAAEWHPTKNRLTPADVLPKSNTVVWWRCVAEHEWKATVASRHKNGCRKCADLEAHEGHNLALLHPDIAAEWHPTRNGNTRPTDVTPASEATVWWRCWVYPTLHEWPARVYSRTRRRGTGCPMCAGREASPTNDLNLFPKPAAELDLALNSGRVPETVVAGSHEKLWWRCQRNSDHVWRAEVVSRTALGAGCPRCPITHSGPEVEIAQQLALVLGFDPDRHHLDHPELQRLNLDIVIEERKLIVEYDGWHWHRPRRQHERDRRKTRQLIGAGYTVVRIRCGLDPVGPHDVSAPRRDDPTAALHGLANRLLDLGMVDRSEWRQLVGDPTCPT